MNEYTFTDNKKSCIILAVLFWGLLQFCEFGAGLLLELFPRELLIKYIDPVVYGTFFLATVIVFRKVFWSAIKDFIRNIESYAKWSAILFFVTLVLMVASAIILDSFGIGESSNQEAIDSALKQYGVLQLITVCLIGPVVEEVMYRGILFGALQGKEKRIVRSIAAILITALVFAFMHCSFVNFSVQDTLANIPILMFGLTLTTLRWKTDNILCPIIVHVLVNTIGSLG